MADRNYVPLTAREWFASLGSTLLLGGIAVVALVLVIAAFKIVF